MAILRLAPSPTGHLHLGHALSAFINADFARRMGGRLLVRIEDTDVVRCKPEFAVAILDDLAWLGIRPAEPILRQSEHREVYAEAAARLEEMGLVYPCFATRQEIQASAEPGRADPDGAPIYPGTWRSRSPDEIEARKRAGEPFALRLDMVRAIATAARLTGGEAITYQEFDTDFERHLVEARPDRWGDVVLVRKEGLAAYHLAVVVDDARQDVTHVVRGEDLRASTDVHRLLQILLGLPAPLYHHHRLVMTPDGRKLSKRSGDTALATLRTRGLTALDIRRIVGLVETKNT